MEIGPFTRPGLPNVGSRVSPTTVAAPVRVDLPRAAVEQAPRAARPRSEEARPPSARGRNLDRRLELDPATRQIVCQIVEAESGEVVRQVPDEVVMRLRAYARTMRQTQREGTGPVRTV